MASKEDLVTWVEDAIRANGGSARLLDVAKHIWANHESELRASGDLFYKWQYDMRWAANKLRRSGMMKSTDVSPNGVWELA
jgi:hypothetical protein